MLTYQELAREGRTAWRSFEDISADIAKFAELRQTVWFRRLGNAPSGENIHTHFPFLFGDAFPDIAVDTFRTLSVASLCFTYSILIADSVMDEPGSVPRYALVVADSYRTRGWQLIHEALGGRTLPWGDVLRYQAQYVRSMAADSARHRCISGKYSRSDLFHVLSRRCAMSKVLVLTLCAMKDDPKLLRLMERSLDYYWLGLVLMDDYQDWKDDLRQSRYSYLLTTAIGEVGEAQFANRPSSEWQLLIARRLYGSGLLDKYCDLMARSFEKAKRLGVTSGSHTWLNHIDRYSLRVCAMQTELRRSILELSAERTGKKYRLRKNGSDQTAELQERVGSSLVRPISLSHTAECAVDFLRRAFQADTGYADVLTERGCLTNLASAHVGQALRRWQYAQPNAAAGTDGAGVILTKLESLLRAANRKPGWSANSCLPSDAMTTAWVLWFFRGGADSHSLDCGDCDLEFLLKHQRPDGGFATFATLPPAGDFEAWEGSHVEVTAIAAEVLSHRLGHDDPRLRAAAQYLLGRAGTTWNAYWWDGESFSSFLCLRSLAACAAGIDAPVRERIRNRIIASQRPDGGWAPRAGARTGAFETAYSIQTLLYLPPVMASGRAILRGLRWLTLRQLPDGSWCSAPIYRIPPGKEHAPWGEPVWTPDLPSGSRVILRDQRRTVTTAAVLGALSEVIARLGDRRFSITTSAPVTEPLRPVEHQEGDLQG